MCSDRRFAYWRAGLTAVLLVAGAAVAPAAARSDRDDDRVERSDRGEDRADRLDRTDGEDRSDRDTSRIEEREERELRAAEDRQREEARTAEDLREAQEDAAEEAERAERDALRAAEDQAEEAARAAEDAADDAADAAEDAAKAQAEAEEEAAEEAEEAAEEASGRGGAEELRELAAPERPELDRDGFPVRRGEVVALDLEPSAREAAVAGGFAVIETRRLEALDGAMTRLAVPPGLSAREGLDRLRRLDPDGAFDLAHYYGLDYSAAGSFAAAARRVATATPPRRDRQLLVGMIDTAVAPHPALAGVDLRTRDFSGGGAAASHGTAVASLLAGDGAGRILAANVFRGGDRRHFTSADAIVQALGWLAAEQVPVINISLAGPRNLILDRVIARVLAAGHIVVAAAGNEGPASPPAYPAALSGVIAVTAVDERNRVYRYANRGPYIRVAARGVGVPAATPDGRLAPHSGTSFAAPHVAAVLARCARRVSTANAGCVAAMERDAVDLGDPGRDPVYGVGLVR